MKTESIIAILVMLAILTPVILGCLFMTAELLPRNQQRYNNLAVNYEALR